MIVSFRSKETELLWLGEFSKKLRLPTALHDLARLKLRMLAAAPDLETLRVPPNNKLEALKRDRKGQHSIRINDQYRICFIWKAGHAHEIEIVDYH